MPKHPKGVKLRKKPEKGNKKKYRGEKLKKGTRGEVTQFVTRSKAVRKLGLTLKDFRRLCILKGIYPREPNKKFEGQHRTYYHKKDIKYLALDPIIGVLRELKIYKRKYRTAMKSGNKIKMKNLKKIKPTYSLKMIVKERYPTFVDAVRDLDDPLCLVNLFSSLPSHRVFKIPPTFLATCLKLKTQFNAYVIATRSLKKVFLSIKGIYYEAEIKGQKVLWLDPYNFAQTLPYDVDYRVMMTFLEFYDVLLKFVMFKLFSESNMTYPPTIDMQKVEKEDFSYNYLEIKKMTIEGEGEQDEKYKISKEFMEDEKVKQIFGNQNKDQAIFDGLVFFVSNEVPREPIELMVLSFGGKIVFDVDNFESEEYTNEEITHVITDRNPTTFEVRQDRDYVQPQWICDSINEHTKLPVGDYSPGKPLPPHLSPFVDDKAEGYVPERRKEIQKVKGEAVISADESSSDDEDDQFNQEEEIVIGNEETTDKIVEESEEEESESEDEDKMQEEKPTKIILDAPEIDQADSDGEDIKPYAVTGNFDFEAEEEVKKFKQKKKEKEKKNLAKIVFTKKKKRIWDRIQYGKNKKKLLIKKLKNKKKADVKSKGKPSEK